MAQGEQRPLVDPLALFLFRHLTLLVLNDHEGKGLNINFETDLVI